jgi:hypothetical protein
MYPAMAIIVASIIAREFKDCSIGVDWVICIPATLLLIISSVIALLVLAVEILPHPLQGHIQNVFPQQAALSAACVLVGAVVVLMTFRRGFWRKQVFLYSATCVGFTLFVFCGTSIVRSVSLARTSKQLAFHASSQIGPHDTVAMYGGYPSSLPFYLGVHTPIWVILTGSEKKILGSRYIATRSRSTAINDQVLLTEQEFADHWRSSEERICIFVDKGAVSRFKDLIGDQSTVILQSKNTVLVENKGPVRSQ